MGLEIDQHAPAVEGGVIAVHTDVRRQALNIRVLQDDLAQFLLTLAHGAERNRLRRLGNPLNHARVLNREEPLGHHHVQKHREREGADGHQQCQWLVLEHPLQHAPVLGDHPVNKGTAGPVETALLFGLGLGFEQACAHHRGQGERHHQRDQNRHRQGDRKFTEQPPDHIRHEQQRDQHGNQRQGQRDQGKANLLGALEGRLHRGFAFLDVA